MPVAIGSLAGLLATLLSKLIDVNTHQTIDGGAAQPTPLAAFSFETTRVASMGAG